MALLFLVLDINECKSHNTCQKNATCINSQGSYRCECKTGYRLEERKCLGKGERNLRGGTCGLQMPEFVSWGRARQDSVGLCKVGWVGAVMQGIGLIGIGYDSVDFR